jgi:hypothetical protein
MANKSLRKYIKVTIYTGLILVTLWMVYKMVMTHREPIIELFEDINTSKTYGNLIAYSSGSKTASVYKDSAKERAVQQGKKPNLQKRAPKNIKDKKNFIDRLILKEKGIDESNNLEEDILVDKEGNPSTEILDQMSLIKRNITALKKLAKKQNISTKQLIDMLNNEF